MAVVNGTDESETIVGTFGADTLNGNGGDDLIDGLGGNDSLNGGNGNDILYGGDGNDTLNGDAGDDILEGEAGDDSLNGGAGFDIASYLNATAGVTVSLLLGRQNTGQGTDTLVSIEGLFGSRYNDRLTGDNGNNLLDGGEGADHLSGGGGDDILQVYYGTDLVAGDRFSGGSGYDILYLASAADLTVATIDADVEALVSLSGLSITPTQLGRFIHVETRESITISSGGVADLTGAAVWTEQFYLAASGITLNLTGNQVAGQTVFGSSAADTVLGGDRDDTFHGGGGSDVLSGGAGNDQLFGEDGDDTLRGGLGNDLLTGSEGNDLLEGEDGDDELHGGYGDDILRGGSGNDTLTDGEDDGSDQLYGGDGDDILRINIGQYVGPESRSDRNVYDGGDGDDTFELSGNASMSVPGQAFIGGTGTDRVNLGHIGVDADLTGFVFDGIEELVGFAGFRLTASQMDGLNYLDSGRGSNSRITITTAGAVDMRGATVLSQFIDLATGGITLNLAGIDRVFSINGSSGDDTVTGGASADEIVGMAGNDILNGDGGDDILTGGGGNDVLFGGAGFDTAIFSGQRSDYTLQTNADGSLTVSGLDGVDVVDGVERLQFSDNTVAIAEGVTWFGDDSDETVNGSDEQDIMRGSGGNDTFHGFGGADLLYGEDGHDSLMGGEGDDHLWGGAGNDILDGGPGGEDWANGEAGDDWISNARHADGGSGDDHYFNNSGISEEIGGGIDTIYVTSNYYDLGASGRIENVYFSWSDNPFGAHTTYEGVTGIGNSYDNIIVGASGNDTLIGGEGNDTLRGEGGDDYLHGDTGNNTLYGGGGNDFLSAADGSNALFGEEGNDTYEILWSNTSVIEFDDEGIDTIVSGINIYMPDNVENLTLIAGYNSHAGIDYYGVGNALDNVITGNNGNNLLLGGAGDDTISGGFGRDALFGEAGNDMLIGGFDTNYLVGGTGDDQLFGGFNADALYGEDGDDVLWGGEGFFTDILVGGAGNDILRGDSGETDPDYDLLDGDGGDDLYWVDTGDDLTFEDVGGGTDTVYADVRVANAGVYLYENVENLVLVGTTAFGVGNGLDNLMIGSASGNYLLGGAGHDVLDGRGGNDVLFGEAGNDVFVFQAGSGGDVIGDFTIGSDRIDLRAFGFANFEDLAVNFSQVGADGAINLGNGDFIVLHGVTMANLTAAQFIFPGQASPAEALAGIIAADDARFDAPDAAPAGADAESGPQVLPVAEDGAGKMAGPQVLPSAPDDLVFEAKGAGPQILPGLADDDFVVLSKEVAGPLVLPSAGPGPEAKDAVGPQVLPGLGADDFIVDKGALDATPLVLPGADGTLDTGALPDSVALKMALWADLGHGLFLPDTSGADVLSPENDWGWA